MERDLWEIEDPSETITPYIISREGDVPTLIAKTYSAAHAEKIVQAVNSHEALVERLQESETLLIGLQALCIHQRYIERIQEQINDNRAALKLAGVK